MKSVLITGGSGSFGQAFTKYLLGTSVQRIVIYSRGEHLQEEMASKFKDERLRFFIGDVRDRKRLEIAMNNVETVIHAAALKIVPTAEYNPTECVATNIGGAENVVLAALGAGVGRVIALSTDKAVNPINLYGASKLAAEKIFSAANNLAGGHCLFSVVRYGNVVGSRGSVLPLFKALAKTQESLPITDDRMTRFWVPMERAVDLVVYAHAAMAGRETFVPKVPSIRMIDLATALGRKWHHVGIRPGEKLHETLVTEDEARHTIETSSYYIINPQQNERRPYSRGKTPKVRETFRYASDTNDDWLTVEELKESIDA
jgi:UDP-N-acetylglucosamine 4,6-dehydratase